MKSDKTSLQIETLVVGSYEVNCYCIFNPHTRNAFIIDPGFECDRIAHFLTSQKLNLTFIINTHGHFDHIGCNHAFSVPIYIHEADADFLTSSQKNLSSFVTEGYASPPATRLLKDLDSLMFDSVHLEIIHTPGHTPGCICIRMDDILFTGDTLFRGSIGRTDFPYGDGKAIIHSITTRIIPLDEHMKIYPGHGPSSTLAYEKKHNFYLQSRR